MKRHPLLSLTLIALLPRLLAAIWAGGYYAHDDHFLVIEAAASWVAGHDYNYWLPWNQGADARPTGHSFVYVGAHYLLFEALEAIGLTDPKGQMVVVRLLHALWSLVVVRVGYRIALRLSDPGTAWRTGLFLALFWFMPFLAVRNLVEVACIPFLMLGAWRLVKRPEEPAVADLLVAGIWLGLAMNVRFQTLFFAFGAGAALLLIAGSPGLRLRRASFFTLGLILPLALLQGGIDLLLWGRPFAEIGEYVGYNMLNATTYFDQPWYNHVLVLAGMFIPIFSLLLLFGFFRSTRPLLLWLPVFAFLAFHSWFPNKQERFILPMVPLYFVLAHVSWEAWRRGSVFWQKHHHSWQWVMRFTWTLNVLLLAVLTFSYSKRSRVEALYLLNGVADVRGIVIEDSAEREAPMPPLFYSGHWTATVEPWTDPDADLRETLERYPVARRPNIVLFFGKEDLEARMRRVEAFGSLERIGEAHPGLVDRIVHWLNPINRNETILVARLTEHEREPAPAVNGAP